MRSGPLENILLIHGYSVRTLNIWGRLPVLLQNDGFKPEAILLSAFVSLDDHVSCDDLANALDYKISALEQRNGIDLRKTAIIVHSTGAIIARRWLLNRRRSGGNTPSHFISFAGANHGSTLSQLGRTELAHLFRAITQHADVGSHILNDLDYGSAFLRQLNREWLTEWNKSPFLYEDTFCFSLGGTDHSFWENQLTWRSHELGSDGTVRISGANLNYRFINVAPPYRGWNVETMQQPCPHMVVETPAKKYSHTNQSAADTEGLVLSGVANAVDQIVHFGVPPEAVTSRVFGILDGIESADELPYRALRDALAVQSVPAYKELAQLWSGRTAAWTASSPLQANSTIIVSISDQNGMVVDDSLVVIRDENGTIANISQSLLPNQPLRNQAQPSVMSFYVNAAQFLDVHPHGIHVEARTDTPYINYNLMVDAQLSGGNDHVIAPNQCTYVNVVVRRDASEAFVFYSASNPMLQSIIDQIYPPFLGNPVL